MRSFVIYVILLVGLCNTVNAQEKTIMVHGDSLSAGYGIQLEEGWVALLAERLKQEKIEVSVINTSVSGETTSGGKARLPKLLETHNPDIVILELGGNDGLQGQPIAITQRNLAQMIETSRGAGAQVLLVGIQIPPNYGPRYTRQFSAIYPALAKSHDVALVPFLLESVATTPELMQRDGIHPTADAQPQLVKTVWPHLLPLLNDNP